MIVEVVPPDQPIYDLKIQLNQSELNVLVELVARVGGSPATVARSTTDKLCNALSPFESDIEDELKGSNGFFDGSLHALK